MVDVPASSVRDELKFTGAFPDAVTVLLPSARLRVPAPALLNRPLVDVNVRLKLPVATSPFSRLNGVALDDVNADPKVQAPPTPLKTMPAAIVTLLVVIVLPAVVELKVIRPVALQTVPGIIKKLPDTARVPVDVNVTVPADTVKLRQVSAPVSVTV